MSTIMNLDNTNFIWSTNFSGDPSRDKYGSTTRKANIVLTPEQVDEFTRLGVNVKSYTFNGDDGQPGDTVFYIQFTVRFDSKEPPRIYLVDEEMNATLLPEEAVGMLDHIKVLSVCGRFNVWPNPKTGKVSVFAKELYVQQDTSDDIFAKRFHFSE